MKYIGYRLLVRYNKKEPQYKYEKDPDQTVKKDRLVVQIIFKNFYVEVQPVFSRDIVVVVPAQAAVMTDIDCCFGRAIEIYKITLRHRLIKASHTAVTTVQKMTGAMIILMSLTKPSPSGFICSPISG